MKHASIVALTLLLAACGRQESVEEVRADRAAANAPLPTPIPKPASDGRTVATGKQRVYVNAPHGYTITLPEGWVRNDGASNADGVVYEDPGAGANVRVFWTKNASNADIEQMIEGMNDEAVEGNFSSPNDYSGTANDGKGNRVAIRILKLPDGSAVNATVAYPEMLSDQYEAIGKAALDSLEVAVASTK